MIILSGQQARTKVEHDHIMTRMNEHTHVHTVTLSPSGKESCNVSDGYKGHVDCDLRGHYIQCAKQCCLHREETLYSLGLKSSAGGTIWQQGYSHQV